MSQALECFRNIFNRLDHEPVTLIRELYTEDIEFRDPIHEIYGLDKLESYMKGLYHGVESCQFDFGEPLELEGRAWQPWTMRLIHSKVHRNGPAIVPGTSELRIRNDKISFHQDYFDVGAMLYEHIPVVGLLVRQVKKRL